MGGNHKGPAFLTCAVKMVVQMTFDKSVHCPCLTLLTCILKITNMFPFIHCGALRHHSFRHVKCFIVLEIQRRKIATRRVPM